MTYATVPPFSTSFSPDDTASVSTGKRRFIKDSVPGSAPLPIGNDPGCANVPLGHNVANRRYVNEESQGGGHNPVNMAHPDRSIVRHVEQKSPSPEKLHRKPGPSPMTPEEFFYGHPVTANNENNENSTCAAESPHAHHKFFNGGGVGSDPRRSVCSQSVAYPLYTQQMHELRNPRPAGAPSSVLNGARPTCPPPLSSLPCEHDETSPSLSHADVHKKPASHLKYDLVPADDPEQFIPSRKLTQSPYRSHIRDLPGFETSRSLEDGRKNETDQDAHLRDGCLTPRAKALLEGHAVVDCHSSLSREDILKIAIQNGAAGGIHSVAADNGDVHRPTRKLLVENEIKKLNVGAAGLGSKVKEEAEIIKREQRTNAHAPRAPWGLDCDVTPTK